MITLFQSLIIKKNKSRKQHDQEILDENALALAIENQEDLIEKKIDVLNNILYKEPVQEIEKFKPEDVEREDYRLKNLFIVAVQ